jgi:alkylation response protein AidB-like acyl-CoA dehydrogenase
MNRLGATAALCGPRWAPNSPRRCSTRRAKLAGDVLAPLRRVGDTQPARCEEQRVVISPGYADALRQLAAGGWFGISADAEHGGQGLPELYGTAANEMWNGADMAFALAPFLSSGAALAIAAHGTKR